MANYNGSVLPLPYSSAKLAGREGVYWPLANAADAVAPIVTVVSPAAGSTITAYTPIVFTVYDEVALAHVEVRVTHDANVETVYNGISFVGSYASSTVVTVGTLMTFTVTRIGGWVESPVFSVTPIDRSGNKA